MEAFFYLLMFCLLAYCYNNSGKSSKKPKSQKANKTIIHEYKSPNSQDKLSETKQEVFKIPLLHDCHEKIHGFKFSNDQKARKEDKWNEIRQEVFKKYGYKCSKCGSCNNIEVHHKIPLSKGGTNNIKNLIPLCHDCHEKIHGFKFGNEKKAPMENYGEQISSKKKNTNGYKINDAIEHGYKLEIEYITQHYPFENEVNIRIIKPQDIKYGYEMMENNDFIRNAKNPNEPELIFIVAFCELRKAIRYFRFDRIKILKVIK